MKKILRFFNVVAMLGIILTLPVACSKEPTTRYDISDIKIDNMKVEATVGKDNYFDILELFFKQVKDNINTIVPTYPKPQYGYDYKVDINNHNLFDLVTCLETIDIKVSATATTAYLKGSFATQVTLINKPQSIAGIKIKAQTFKHKDNNETFQTIIDEMYRQVVKKAITNLVEKAEYKIDYTINVEGHKPDEKIKPEFYGKTKFINVNGINDERHHLIKDSFSFEVFIS